MLQHEWREHVWKIVEHSEGRISIESCKAREYRILEKINVEEVVVRHQDTQEELEWQVRGPMYNIVPLVVISPLESPSSSKCEKGRRFEVGIGVVVWCANEIQESIWHVLKRLQRGILNRKVGVAMTPSAKVEELMKILDLNDEKDKENIGGDQWLIKIALEVWEIT